MSLLRCSAIVVALALAPGCLATWSVHRSLVEPDPDSVTAKVAFYTMLPGLIAIDIVTAPFQYVYVITHAPD